MWKCGSDDDIARFEVWRDFPFSVSERVVIFKKRKSHVLGIAPAVAFVAAKSVFFFHGGFIGRIHQSVLLWRTGLHGTGFGPVSFMCVRGVQAHYCFLP